MPGAVAPSPHVTTLDIVVLAGYLVATMAAGFAVTRRSRSVGGGTLGLFLPGFFSRSAGNRAAQAGVAAGVLLIVWMTFSPRSAAWPAAWRSPFHDFLIIVFGTAAVMVVVLAAGWTMSVRARREPQP